MKRTSTGNLLFLLFFLPFILTCKPTMTISELAPQLYKSKLKNGLTVIVKETPGTKVATLQIWVKAGSVYEAPDEAGITHLIEHMIFKGTPTLGPGEFAATIESLGGRLNAYTSYEYTVYHATLSSRHWRKTMEVLADAVLNASFDPAELEREKPVVIEEIGMRRDRPTSRLFEALMENVYTTHPYRLPIIGSKESVSSFSREEMLKYIDKHYHPENMTVVVVGDLEAPGVIDGVNKLMGKLRRGGGAQPQLPSEPEQHGTRVFNLEDDIQQTHMAMAFPICRFDSPDTPVMDVLSHILAHGDTSRLYHRLRDQEGLVFQIDGVSFTPRDPGVLELMATLEPERMEPALAATLEEIFRLKYQPVSDEELDKAKLNLESDFIFNLEQLEGQARILGSFEFLADDPRESEYLERLRQVSAADIMRVASTYFIGSRLTAGAITPKGAGHTLSPEAVAKIIEAAEKAVQPGTTNSTIHEVEESFLSEVSHFRLGNGIRVVVREDPTIPTVAIRAVFPGGLRGETEATNGAFAFIKELLPKGTEQLSSRQLSLRVANMAGELSGFNGKNTFGIRADFLSRFFDEGLTLVRDVIRTPAFSAEEAERIRPEMLSQLKKQEDALPTLAMREFNRLLFAGHPYGLNTAGSAEAIGRLSSADLKKLYQRHAQPGNLVLAVSGAVTAEQVRAEVERLFGDWRVDAPPAEVKAFAVPQPPTKPISLALDRNRAQTHIIIGFLGTTLKSEDRFGLEVLEAVLNGQSGRLFTRLRDQQSLAYSLSAFSLLGLDTGAFGVYIGTSPEKRQEAVAAIWLELERLRSEKVGAEELNRAKNVLVGQYELGLQGHGAQAMDLALSASYDLGLEFGSRYIRDIEKVDADSLQALANRYITPDQSVMVTVGANPTDERNEAQ